MLLPLTLTLYCDTSCKGRKRGIGTLARKKTKTHGPIFDRQNGGASSLTKSISAVSLSQNNPEHVPSLS